MSKATIGNQNIAVVGLIIKHKAIIPTYLASFETKKFIATFVKHVSMVLISVLEEAQGNLLGGIDKKTLSIEGISICLLLSIRDHLYIM